MGGLNEKQLTIVSIVGGVVLTAVIGVLCYLEYEKINIKKEEEAKLAKQLTGYNRKISKIPALTEEIKTLQKTFMVYKGLLPAGKQEIERFYEQIGEWRRQLGIKAFPIKTDKSDLPEIWPEEAEKAKKGGPAPPPRAPVAVQDYVINSRFIQMDVSFWQLGQFLNLIENWDRLAIVTDLTINTGNKYKYGDIKLKVGFGLKTFFYTGAELPEEIRDDPEFQEIGKQKVTDEIREMVFGKRFTWKLQGTDDWYKKGGSKPGEKGPNAMPRNPFDPYPALTLKADEDTEYVEGLERELGKIEKQVRIKAGKDVVLPMLAELRKKAKREPSGEDALRRWRKVNERCDEIEKAYAPDEARTKELARIAKLEKALANINTHVKDQNFRLASNLLKRLERDSALPPKTSEAKRRWDVVRSEIPKIRRLLVARDAGEALAKARKLLAEIKANFDKEEYAPIDELTDQIGQHTKAWPNNSELQSVFKQARQYRDRARVRLQLSRFKLQLTGVVDITNGPKFAFINGSRYTVGDMIQVGGKQIKIVGIKAARDDREMVVTFEYEGEQFSRTKKI